MTITTNQTGYNALNITPASASPWNHPLEPTITYSDDSIVTLDVGGTSDGEIDYSVFPQAEGTTTVTATYGELTTSFEVEVTAPIPAESLAFPDDMPTELNQTGPGSSTDWLYMVVTPANADVTGLEITSSEPTMLEVQQYPANPAKFQLFSTLNAEVGTDVTITATLGELTVTATVSIVAPVAMSIAFAAPGWNMMTTDDPIETAITVLPNGASTDGLTVVSSDDAIATVTQDVSDPTAITITAVADGEVTLTATLGELTATAGVAVGSQHMNSGYLPANI